MVPNLEDERNRTKSRRASPSIASSPATASYCASRCVRKRAASESEPNEALPSSSSEASVPQDHRQEANCVLNRSDSLSDSKCHPVDCGLGEGRSWLTSFRPLTYVVQLMNHRLKHSANDSESIGKKSIEGAAESMSPSTRRPSRSYSQMTGRPDAEDDFQDAEDELNCVLKTGRQLNCKCTVCGKSDSNRCPKCPSSLPSSRSPSPRAWTSSELSSCSSLLPNASQFPSLLSSSSCSRSSSSRRRRGAPSKSTTKSTSSSLPIFSCNSFSRLLAVLFFVSAILRIAEACSSRSTPKPRPPSPTTRPNITFQTYACPEAYAKWYCLNGATCFSVRIGESILYNCECPDGYMGQRCEFKDLDGSYLPSREKIMIEKASIAGGVTCAVLLMVFVYVFCYTYVRSRKDEKFKGRTVV